MKRLFYDGSAASVDKIMDVVGTKGVNNVEGKRLYIRGDYLDKGDCIQIKDGWWWIDHGFKVSPTKYVVVEKLEGMGECKEEEKCN